jgi:hypothetical protein
MTGNTFARVLRIASGLALPTLFAVLTMLACAGLWQGLPINLNIIKMCGSLLPRVYALAIIPGLLSIGAFEWARSRKLIHGKTTTLLFTLLLGLLSGGVIAASITLMSGVLNNKELLIYLPLGAWVGFLMGLVYLLIDRFTVGRE